MSNKQLGLFSGRVKKTPSTEVSADRYDWLKLQEAEPDLGVPSVEGGLPLSTTEGLRTWTSTLQIDEQGNLNLISANVTTDLTTIDIVNTNATTVNFAGAATEINIGSDTGTTYINHDLNVAGTVNFDSDIGLEGDLTANGGDIYSTAEQFNIVNKDTSTSLTNDGPTTVTAFLNASTVELGASTGTLTVNNPTIAGTQTTQTLWNTTATTVNFAGAASTLNIGASTGTATIKNANVILDGDLQVKGGDLTTTATTFNLIDATATTVNFAGAATAIDVGANTGTLTINNPTVVGSQATVNLWNTGATTVNFAGDATAVSIGNVNATVVIPGNLTVQGTTTTFETEVLKVEDKNIELGVAAVPTDVLADGGGITLHGTSDKIIAWYDATDSWTSNQDFDLVTGKSYKINNVSVLTSSAVLHNALTVDAFISATDIQIGSAVGTTNINNNLDVDGDVNIDGGDLTVSTSTFNLANTTATTVNFAGAATAVNIGSATGTATIKNANVVLDGDLQVKGGDLTTNQTTFNLLNTTATTVNFAGAATDIQIGSSSGTTNVNNNLDVGGDINIDGGDLTVSTSTFNLANTNATTVNFAGAATDIQIGSSSGTTNVNNNLDVDGDINIDGGDLTVSTSTFNLANTTATTVNFAGAATTVNIGAATGTTYVNNDLYVDGVINVGSENSSTLTSNSVLTTATTVDAFTSATSIEIGAATGTTNINNDLVVDGDVTIKGGDLTTNQTTFNVLNDTATTVNAFGAASTLNLGASSGTLTVKNPTIVGTATTQNLFNTSATTVNFAGAATAINIGATTGILTVNNPTVVGTQTTQNLFNTIATTVNFAGAATNIQIGSDNGTTNVNNNLDVDGDVNIDGGDLTVSTSTFNLANTTATTVNFAGAATTVNIGAATGTATIKNESVLLEGVLHVNGGAIRSDDTTFTLLENTVTSLSIGLAATSIEIGAATGTTNINNSLDVDGDVNIDGGDLTVSTSTFNLANTTATTVNFAGAATTVNIGAATGTTYVKNNLNVAGDVQIGGSSVINDAGAVELFNTGVTSVLAFGQATSIEIGAATGTTNINNSLDVDGDVNIDGGDLTVSTSTFNLANTTATTVNFAGAATAVNIGSATGTTNINNSFEVDGTSTTIRSIDVSFNDPILTIGGNTTASADDNKDRGIEFQWHTGTTAKTGFFGYDDSTGYFTFIPDATNSSEVIGGTPGDIQATNFRGALIGNADTASKWANSRTVTFGGGDVTGSFSIDGSADVSNIALTIQANSVALGTDTTGQYASTVAVSGTGLSCTTPNADDSTAYTITSNATADATPNTLVARDSSGAIAVGPLTATTTVINGSLTVNGTMYTINSEETNYTDPVLNLHVPALDGELQPFLVAQDNQDIGIKYHYYDVDPVGNYNIVTGGSGDGTTATLNVTGAPYPVGGIIVISGVQSATGDFNGTYRITASDASSISYLNSTNDTVITTGELGRIYRTTEFATTSGSSSGTTATINYTGPALANGNVVSLTGITPSGYNGTYEISNVSAGSFNVTTLGSDLGNITVQGKIVIGERYAFSGFAYDHNAFEFYNVGVESGDSKFGGIYGTIKTGTYWSTPARGQSAADMSAGIALKVPERTIYDVETSASGTVSQGNIARIDQITLDATSTGVTYSNAASLYIANAPAAGHNVTITNGYAIEVAAGTSKFGGQIKSTVTTGTAPLEIASTTVVTNLNADLLDGQQGSWYQDWANITNKPDPVITVTLTGDVAGTANTTLTDLASGTITISTTVQPNSVALGTDTTGNYMVDVAAGTGIAIVHTPGEGSTATISVTDLGSSQNIYKNISDGTTTATAGNNNDTIRFRSADGVTVAVGSNDGTYGDNLLIGLSNVPNSSLANSSVTFGTTTVSLGGSSSTIAGLTSVTATTFNGALSGNASTATKLATARSITATGDASWTVSFDGSADVSAGLTLATQAGLSAGTYNNVTVNTKGIVTAASNVTYLTDQSTDFKTVTVTDTDSGYTWAETGSAVAETVGDTLTIVSGANINVDVDATNDAIRITNTFVESTDFKTITVSDTDSGYTWSNTGSAVADSVGDTLTLISGTGINIDVDPTNDAIRINTTTVISDSFGIIAIDNTDTEYSWTDTDGTTVSSESGGDTLKIVAAKTGSTYGIKVRADGTNGAVGIAHGDTSTQTTVTNTGNNFVQSITLDEFGHITAISSGAPTSSDTLSDVTARGATTSYAISITDTTETIDTSTGALKVSGGIAAGKNILTAGSLINRTTAGVNVSYQAGLQQTLSTVTPTAIDYVDVTAYRSAKYIIQISQGSNYQVSELLVIHNGSGTTYNTEYAVVETNGSLATFTTDVSAGNIRLIATMASATAATIKIQRTLMAI